MLDEGIDAELGRELLPTLQYWLWAKLQFGGSLPMQLGSRKLRLVTKKPSTEDVLWAQHAVLC